jgi:PAS domain S-box-containing protein
MIRVRAASHRPDRSRPEEEPLADLLVLQALGDEERSGTLVKEEVRASSAHAGTISRVYCAAMATEGNNTSEPSLPLILARELAANLATPMFLIDASGMLVYFNEAAELMLGKSYAEVGGISANEFGAMLELGNVDETPMRRRDSPAGVAFYKREPAHRRLLATTLDGTRQPFEVTAYPLFGHVGDMHGVLTVFWRAKE